VWRCPAAAGPVAPPAAAASAAEAATAVEEVTAAEAGTVAVPLLAAASSNGAPSRLHTCHIANQQTRVACHCCVCSVPHRLLVVCQTLACASGAGQSGTSVRAFRPSSGRPLQWRGNPAAAASWLPADGPCIWDTPCSAPSRALRRVGSGGIRRRRLFPLRGTESVSFTATSVPAT